MQYLTVIHGIQGTWGWGVGRVAVPYVVPQFLKCFVKQVRFMKFLSFCPLSLLTLGSADCSWLHLGETEVGKRSVPTSLVNNWVAGREDGEAVDVPLCGYHGHYILSFFSAPISYLEPFPHSACAALSLQPCECTSVGRDAQQNVSTSHLDQGSCLPSGTVLSAVWQGFPGRIASAVDPPLLWLPPLKRCDGDAVVSSSP